MKTYILRVLFWLAVSATSTWAIDMVDRIVATINDQAITLSELEDKYAAMRKIVPSMTEQGALNSMINSALLLEKARQMKLEGKTPDDLIAAYIDLRIRGSVIVREDDVEKFYRDNRQDFAGKSYESVHDQIERYLVEEETTRLLKKHLEELRAAADITILLSDTK